METQERMEIYKKVGTPGAPHQLLAKMAGNWNTRGRFWMEPGQAPVESTGRCEQKMVLDGRFLQEILTGEMMGSPFTGISYTGYDNHTGKYVTTWMDSMSTAIMVFEGTTSADGTLTQISHYDDPVKGPMQWRSVSRLVDADTMEFEMFTTDKSGKEEKMMEITYTRATPAETVLKH